MQNCGPGPRVSTQAFPLFRGILWATLLSGAILSAVLGERAAAATQGTLAFSPSGANFQSVTVGTQKTITLTITNTGAATVAFSREALYANDFSETGLVLRFSVAPGAHFTVTIKFLPKLKILAAGFIPGAEEYNGHREAGRHGFAPSPGPRIRQTFTSPPLKGAPKIKHASEKT